MDFFFAAFTAGMISVDSTARSSSGAGYDSVDELDWLDPIG